MERKPLWKRLLFPPVWLLALLTVFSAAALPLVFLRDLDETPAAYAVYAVAFYTVCAGTAFCAVELPKRRRQLREQLYANPLARRYFEDAAFKTHVKLYAALAANLLYAGVNVLSWRLYHSMWFAVLAVYYGILAVMRFLLVRYVHAHGLGGNRLRELRRARLCAVILLTLNVVLTGAVLMILYQNRGFAYHGVLIYVMAAYTFYSTVHAAVDLVRYRRYRSGVMTMSKVIALSAALVSMLALETAMFSQFGADMAPETQRLMIALTGAGVSAAVIAMAVGVIVWTAKEIKEIETDGREKREL